MADPAAVDAFVASITTTIRRSLFQKLKGLEISQSELTALVASATREAIAKSYVADLAVIAVAGGAAAEAYGETAPEGDPMDPSVVAWRERRDGAPLLVRELFVV